MMSPILAGVARFSPLLSIAAGLLTASPSGAQDTGLVVGSVVDDLRDVPLDGAVVSIVGTDISVTTSEGGRFRVAASPSGTTTLRIALSDYVTVVERVEVPPADVASVEVRLVPVASVLEDIMVTTRAQRSATWSPDEVEIPERDGRHKTAMDLVRTAVPGLFVASGNAAGTGRGSSVRIRGATSLVRNRPAIYVDGVRVAEVLGSAGGTHILDLISADDVERIQVLRGASAEASYGADAMNGVIVIETRRPSHEQR
jgi:TonB-dependent SusC/RagA subfamily outer membrane receptor